MGLAFAVHIASKFIDWVRRTDLPYLSDKHLGFHHDQSVALPVLFRLIKMVTVWCFVAMRFDRSMKCNAQPMEALGLNID
jgi:hypothetical protein